MKFRLTLTYEYEVEDSELAETYGTTNPVEAAEIDRQNLVEDPGSLDLLADYRPPLVVKVEPVAD